MKKSLLEIVKDILSSMDSEDVNTISDTVEGLQVAKIVEETFYDIIATRDVPEHESLLKLTSLSESARPTHFVLEDDQARIKEIWYDVSDTGIYDYRQIKHVTPTEFFRLTDGRQDDYTSVNDKTSNTKLRITNNQHPTYWTTFDDKHIVMDAYKSTVDSVLASDKTRAIGTTYPTFSISDDYVPDIDSDMFPYLIREATSRCFSIFKGAPDQKIEQAARRQKVHVQNDKRRLGARDKKRDYGRR